MTNHHLASKLKRVAAAKERQSAYRLASARRAELREEERLARLEAENAALEERATTQPGMSGLDVQMLYASRVRHHENVAVQRERIDRQSNRVHAATDELKKRRRDSQIREAVSLHFDEAHLREVEDSDERERDDQNAARWPVE